MKYGGKTVEELKSLLKWSTPGDYSVDQIGERSRHGEPAYTNVLADHPTNPLATVVICDTLNSDSWFSPEDDRANMDCLVAAREALLPLLERVEVLEAALSGNGRMMLDGDL